MVSVPELCMRLVVKDSMMMQRIISKYSLTLQIIIPAGLTASTECIKTLIK